MFVEMQSIATGFGIIYPHGAALIALHLRISGKRYRDVIKPKAGGQGGALAPLHVGSEVGAAKPVL